MKLPPAKNVCVFLIWPVLVPVLIVVLGVFLVAVWPMILTDKCKLESDKPS